MKLLRTVALGIAVIDLVLLAVVFTIIAVQWVLNGAEFDYGPDDRDGWTDDDEYEATAAYLRSTPDV